MDEPKDRTLTDEDIQRLIEIHERYRSHDLRTRDANHTWVVERRSSLAQSTSRRRDLMDKIVGALVTAGVLGALAFIGHLIINAVISSLSNGGSPPL